MKLVGRVPVEPLDDERLTNIERSIVAGAADAAMRGAPARSRWYLGVVAAAVAAMVVGVVGYKLGTVRAPAPVVGEAAPVRVDTTTQRATLDIGDATIQSDPSTVFVVTRPAGGVLVDMTRGKVELQVGKRGDRAPLVVRAGDTDVIVVGTHFTVDYGDGTGEVDVRVTEGVVKVVRHAQEVRVAAGATWRTKLGLLAVAEAQAADVRDGVVAAADHTGTGTGTGTTEEDGQLAAIELTHEGSGAFTIPLGDGPDVLKNRVAQVPDTRVPTQGATTETRTTATGTRQGSGASLTTTTPTEPVAGDFRDLKKLVAAQPVMPAMDVTADNAGAAVAKYQEIIRARPSGEEESRAYYGIAFMQAIKLGRTADALQSIDNYMRRFSGGKVYPERVAALWLRVRILCGRAIDGECRSAASTYAKFADDGPAANVARRITLDE